MNYSELISKYFDGLFSKDEVRWFNRKLIDDKELAAEFKLYIEIDKAISNEDIDSLRLQLDKLTNDEDVNANEGTNYLDETSLYEEIDIAIMEEDVLKLRTSLDKLNYEKVEENEKEMADFSSELSQELLLYDEIDQAINDKDINELKEKLESIHNEVEYEIFKPEKAIDNGILNQEIDDALDDNGIWELRNKLDSIHEDIIKTDVKKPLTEKKESPVFKLFSREKTGKSLFTPMKIASSVIIIAAGIMTIILMSSSDIDKLYSKNMKAYSAPGNTRGGNNSSVNIKLDKAIDAYSGKNYSQAALFYREAGEQNPLTIKNKLFYANAAIMSGDFSKSEELLSEIIADSHTEMYDVAVWYSAMISLRNEYYKKAAENFAILAEDEEMYNHEKAVKILKKIQKE